MDLILKLWDETMETYITEMAETQTVKLKNAIYELEVLHQELIHVKFYI